MREYGQQRFALELVRALKDGDQTHVFSRSSRLVHNNPFFLIFHSQ